MPQKLFAKNIKLRMMKRIAFVKNAHVTYVKFFSTHIKNENDTRTSFRQDTDVVLLNADFIIASVDIQKALLMLKLETTNFSSRNLVLFNEMFAQPGENGKTYTLIWHKRKAERSASEIFSVYVTSFQSNFLKLEISYTIHNSQN